MARRKPKLLLDENIGAVPADVLRRHGYDVLSVAESHAGIADTDVLSLAVETKRIVVTLDHDFGTLVFVQQKANCGVILLRLKRESPGTISRLLLNVLSTRSARWEGAFTVANEITVRVRRSR